MKSHLLSGNLALGAYLIGSLCNAQSLILKHRIFDPPLLSSQSGFTMALSQMGFKKTNYSVLVKVRLPGDSVYYTIPGVVPTGQSLGVLLKVGPKYGSDTLHVFSRDVDRPLRVEEINVMAFHPKDRVKPGRPDRDFTKAVLTGYFDANTSHWQSSPKANLDRESKTVPEVAYLPVLALRSPKHKE